LQRKMSAVKMNNFATDSSNIISHHLTPFADG